MSQYTEVSEMGWFARIKNAFVGILFGFVLTAGAVVLLFWNEGRAVKRYQTLKEGQKAVVSVPADAVNAAMEGKLVHVSGQTDIEGGPLKDGLFGVTHDGVKLRRSVEMFQWTEDKETRKEKKTGGGTRTVTTYSYSKDWEPSIVKSENFKERAGHENPLKMPFQSDTMVAETVTLGAFKVPDFFKEKIGAFEPLTIESLDGGQEEIRSTGKLQGDQVYFGADPVSPEIGDMRVEFSVVNRGPLTLVAQQSGDSFSIYQLKKGAIELISESTKSAEEMFADAHTSNKIVTWALRGGSFVLMAIGFGLFLRPLTVMADFLPFIGNIVGAGSAFVAMLLAGVVSAVTIAVAWIFYRPIIGITLFLVALALIVWLVMRARKPKYGAAMDVPPPLN